MGSSGACSVCHPQIPMSYVDASRWVRGTNNIELLQNGQDLDSRTCMSWSTRNTCEFKQNEWLAIQATLKSSKCEGIWAAPLWICPEHWQFPQHATGEIDIFERGCDQCRGYVLSVGESQQFVFRNAWHDLDPSRDSIFFTAYLTFDRDKDEVKAWKCEVGAEPIRNQSLDLCTPKPVATFRDYFKNTARQTNNGNSYMHLVSDIWNKCDSMACRAAHKSDSSCSFKVSDIRLKLTKGARFKRNNKLCKVALTSR